MEDILDDFEQPQNLTDKDIFTKIWTSPRKVFRFINNSNYDKYVIVLLILSGISRAFDRASMRDMGDTFSIWAILGICIFIGGLIGWIPYYLFAALVSWTGKWLKGEGDIKSILRILSYAMIPSVIALIFLIPQIGIYGNEMFKYFGDITTAGLIANILVYGSLILEFGFGIWAIILCVIGISEVQKLSIGMAIINLLLAFLIFAVPFFLIGALISKF